MKHIKKRKYQYCFKMKRFIIENEKVFPKNTFFILYFYAKIL